MFADVKFYSVPWSAVNGIHAISTDMETALTPYLINTIENMKLPAFSLIRDITVPEFTGCDEVNLILIRNDFFNVQGIDTMTNQAGSIRYRCTYDAVSSQLTPGANIRGSWDRLPIMTTSRKEATTEEIRALNRIDLPSLSKDYAHHGGTVVENASIYWIEFTTTQDLIHGTDSDNIRRYGFFSLFNSNFIEVGINWYLTASTPPYPMIEYLNLQTLINEPHTVGIKADAIKSISISERCPYKVKIETTYNIGIGTNEPYPQTWRLFKINSDGTEYNKGIYALSNIMVDEYLLDIRSIDLSNIADNPFTICTITDSIGNVVGKLNLQNQTNKTIECFAISDMTGICTIIRPSADHSRSITFPEGHLPWSSDSWEQYIISGGLERDREQVSFAKQQAAISAVAGFATGGISSAMSGKLATGNKNGAVGGLVSSGIGSAIGFWQQTQQLEHNQEIKEKEMKADNGNIYGMSYGMSYIRLRPFISSKNMDNGESQAAILVMGDPDLDTDEKKEDYIREYGYFAQGTTHKQQTIQEGYWRGRLLSPISNNYGVRYDALNVMFVQGFRCMNLDSTNSLYANRM